MIKQLQKEFVEALRIAVDECGSQSELSRRSGGVQVDKKRPALD